MLVTSRLKEAVWGNVLFTWNVYGMTQLFGFKSNQTFKAVAWTFRTGRKLQNF